MCVCVSLWLWTTHGPYQISNRYIIYSWVKSYQEKLRNRKKRWKCKIKYQTETRSTDTIAVNITSTPPPPPMPPPSPSSKKDWLFSVKPRKITRHNTATNQHECYSQIVELYSIGLKYLFRIFYVCACCFFFSLVQSSFDIHSIRTRCVHVCGLERKRVRKTRASDWKSVVTHVFIHSHVETLLHCRCHQNRLNLDIFSHMQKVFVSIVGLFVCLLCRWFFTKNTKIILYHYNKTMFDNIHTHPHQHPHKQWKRLYQTLHAITMNANINVRDWCHTHHPSYMIYVEIYVYCHFRLARSHHTAQRKSTHQHTEEEREKKLLSINEHTQRKCKRTPNLEAQ